MEPTRINRDALALALGRLHLRVLELEAALSAAPADDPRLGRDGHPLPDGAGVLARLAAAQYQDEQQRQEDDRPRSLHTHTIPRMSEGG
jgi:hypothetical protein